MSWEITIIDLREEIITCNLEGAMNIVDRNILNLLMKASKEVIVREKNGQSFCPAFWHQPQRPIEKIWKR